MSNRYSIIHQQQQQQQRRQILTEEEYQSTLEQIIQREYFPDLIRLQSQVALQQARERNDCDGTTKDEVVREIRRATRELLEHEQYEKEYEDAQETAASTTSTGLLKEPRPLHRETLQGFHARVTSEDNAEFEKVQTLEVKKKKEEQEMIQQQAVLALTNGAVVVAAETNKTIKKTKVTTPHALEPSRASNKNTIICYI